MRFPNLICALAERRIAHFEVADAIGVSESRLSRCLRGRYKLSPVERIRIARFLALDADWLFKSIDVPEPKKASDSTFGGQK